MAEVEETEAQEQGGGSKKMIVIFAVVLLIAVGGSVGGTMFLLGSDEEGAAEEIAAEPVPTKALYHELRPAFIVNYNAGAKPRYLQTELSVMSRSPAAIDAVIAHSPLVRARVLEHLTNQSFDELQTEEGKAALLDSLSGLLNDLLAGKSVDGEVEAVFLSSFVMQ